MRGAGGMTEWDAWELEAIPYNTVHRSRVYTRVAGDKDS